MIDIDHFKKVNDIYGHVVGDALLVAVARAIFGQIRQDDTLSSYGGEKFALTLPGTPFAASRSLLSQLNNSIASISHKLDDGNCINVTASIGAASNMDRVTHFERTEDLIKAANFTLYAAKHAGRNQTIE